MKILVLPGDGIGPEITAATLGVLHAVNDLVGLALEFETHEIGLASLQVLGSTLPEEVVARVTEVDGVTPRAGVALRLPATGQGRDQPVR